MIEMLKSQRLFTHDEYLSPRAAFKSMGYGDADFKKPIIGIANSFTELVPGHANLRELADWVKRGIYAGGGTAAEFGVLATCDCLSNGHKGQYFSLPSRDIIADGIEAVAEASLLDGLVMLGSCDKIIPGMMMAAARLNIPSIILCGGPMLSGLPFDGRCSDFTSLTEAFGMLKAGKITRDDLNLLEDQCGPTCGSCQMIGTANTMCCLSEVLGLSLPGSAAIPAVYAERKRAAQASGEAIVSLVLRDVRPDVVITKQSIQNAIIALNAIGGSTNAVLHLLALANEIDVQAGEVLGWFEDYGKTTPLISKIFPASKYTMEDFYRSGGIPQVLKELEDSLFKDCMTVSGKTMGENIESYPYSFKPDRELIKTADRPFGVGTGVAILRGNLAPDTCVSKPSAIHPSQQVFTGKALVFDSEEEANEAIIAERVKAGGVVVIRYEGPKGAPGMREMFSAMKLLYGFGLGTSTAVVTDGRFSGTNNGCFVGHISPEAAEGGPLAIVQDGDEITIDLPNRALTLHVPDQEIQDRLKKWTPPMPKYTKGHLSRYAKMAQSASKGGILKLD
ncbi:MAG: dihydroxy-acid dehydratase [Synergistaceae bacterium]|jgi:dihydroxy-acid dehydratase|nr:dihydroxy-acid dehydratase [Synergistaceae bacterium]